MKKRKFFFIVCTIIIMGGITFMYNNHSNPSDDTVSSIIARAMADGESGCDNTGPKDSQTCGAIGCNITEYYCECNNEYCCTESLCSRHH